MPNLQIKGIDEQLYQQVKALAASENRSVSQQVTFLIKRYLATKHRLQKVKTPAQILLDLSSSWEDESNADEIISKLKRARKNSTRLKDGL